MKVIRFSALNEIKVMLNNAIEAEIIKIKHYKNQFKENKPYTKKDMKHIIAIINSVVKNYSDEKFDV